MRNNQRHAAVYRALDAYREASGTFPLLKASVYPSRFELWVDAGDPLSDQPFYLAFEASNARDMKAILEGMILQVNIEKQAKTKA